jgi:hypothetical protein
MEWTCDDRNLNWNILHYPIMDIMVVSLWLLTRLLSMETGHTTCKCKWHHGRRDIICSAYYHLHPVHILVTYICVCWLFLHFCRKCFFVIYVMHVHCETLNFSWQSLFQCRAFWVMQYMRVAKLRHFRESCYFIWCGSDQKLIGGLFCDRYVWKTEGSTLNLSVQVLGYAVNAVTLWCIHFHFVYYAKKERKKERKNNS